MEGSSISTETNRQEKFWAEAACKSGNNCILAEAMPFKADRLLISPDPLVRLVRSRRDLGVEETWLTEP